MRSGGSGATGAGNLFSEEMGVWGELKLRNLYANPDCNPIFWDDVLLDALLARPEVTLLLNTDVQEIKLEGGRVRAVRGAQQASEQNCEVRAEYFIDATGDGVLGAKAGLPFQMGGRIYDTAAGPGPLEVLGSSILYYVKRRITRCGSWRRPMLTAWPRSRRWWAKGGASSANSRAAATIGGSSMGACATRLPRRRRSG